MDNKRFVYGDESRIFINTDLGCRAKCKYCYLPSLKISHGENKISALQAINYVEQLEYYIPGKKGSIISIGCYSECMDEDNVLDTILLVQHFLSRGNYVQLATKKEINRLFFEKVSRSSNVNTQLWINISMPVISKSETIEEGTDLPHKRLKNFDLCKEFDINCALYIKPYMEYFTDTDISEFISIIQRYKIPVIVGELLTTQWSEKKALVGEECLYEHKKLGMDNFVTELCKYTKVYLHSTECMR